MLITRIPPTVPELVARALADTPFLVQIAGVRPDQVTTDAELAASLAAEQWEAERHTLIGLTLPPDLIAAVAQALIVHAAQLDFEADLYDWHPATLPGSETLPCSAPGCSGDRVEAHHVRKSAGVGLQA